LAGVVLRVTGATVGTRNVPYESVFPGATDVLARTPDTSYLNELLGYRPQWPSIETIVRDTWESR
jgi:UDP-glucose 4-epimerase